MNDNSTKFPIAIVSTDTTALREIAWTLASYGFQGVPFSDWSEQAPWRQANVPGLAILDARDEEQIRDVLAVSRSASYTYRIALYDGDMLANPDILVDLGADDLVRYPLNTGELISCLRSGFRRLEFERRFSLSATFDQQRGVANRRGFTLQLERKLQEEDNKTDSALVVLGIDFLEKIREQRGIVAIENACSLAAETVFGTLSAQDCRGILEEGVFAVLLQGQSVSDGVLFASEVNEQFATIIGKGIRPSLSGVVANWPSGDTAKVAIERAMAALEHVKGWGGNQVLDINEVEREYTAWQLRYAVQEVTDARHVMDALPLVLPLHSTATSGALGISAFASGFLPPCVPVVDDVGHLVGVVNPESFPAVANDILTLLDDHFEPATVTLRGDSRFDEIASSLESADSGYLLVVENKKPIGYVTNETIAAVRTKIAVDSTNCHYAAADCGLSSLVVPLI